MNQKFLHALDLVNDRLDSKISSKKKKSQKEEFEAGKMYVKSKLKTSL